MIKPVSLHAEVNNMYRLSIFHNQISIQISHLQNGRSIGAILNYWRVLLN